IKWRKAPERPRPKPVERFVGRAAIAVAASRALAYCIPAMTSDSHSPRRAAARAQSALPAAGATAPRLEPIATSDSFKTRAYAALKDAIAAMDGYRSRADIRLDEGRLALDFGISRTPGGAAMAERPPAACVRAGPRPGPSGVR